MLTRILTYVSILGFLALASGCAVEEFQEPMGFSVRQAMQSQRLVTEPADDTPVEGLDGVKAKGVMDAYRKPPEANSGSGQKESNVLNLQVGGSSSGNKK